MSDLFDRFNNAPARIEVILFIAGMINSEGSLPDPLDDLLADSTEKELKECFPGMPDHILEALELRHARGEAFSEWALESGTLGFLVQFAAPVIRSCGGPGAFSYSWGHYYTKWVYGDTFDLALERGFEWVQQMREKDLAKAGEPTGAGG